MENKNTSVLTESKIIEKHIQLLHALHPLNDIVVMLQNLLNRIYGGDKIQENGIELIPLQNITLRELLDDIPSVLKESMIQISKRIEELETVLFNSNN